MDEVGDRICRLIESERLKNGKIGRLKDENNGLVLKVEEEREKWTKVCYERDGIKANSDGLFEEIGDLRKKMIEMEKNEKRALEETEDLKVKCKKLSTKRMESEIMNRNLLKEKKFVKRLLDESGKVFEDLAAHSDSKLKEKDVEMLTQQRDLVDVNLNRVQQEAVSLRRTIEIITCDKAEMEEAKMKVENVVVDLRRELSKVNEAMTSESSVAENGRNKESVPQMGCSRENSNEVSPEKDNLSLPIENKKRKLKRPRLSSRKRKRHRVKDVVFKEMVIGLPDITPPTEICESCGSKA
ncbi:uncharacterized protein LOC111788427 [Cucurbita pepo subsp. pepo]|uniref:uncharacterized protein LOC111788427 n=1 Tax=Cucurbita pepo subsp. pepo TaxID=3664 RepID=UPI000C9DA12D|nr:uncharacterized protein LOC111788427 [Cucurbita pepo subsp. pepo]